MTLRIRAIFDGARRSGARRVAQTQLPSRRFTLCRALCSVWPKYNQGLCQLRTSALAAWRCRSPRAKSRFSIGSTLVIRSARVSGEPRAPGSPRKRCHSRKSRRSSARASRQNRFAAGATDPLGGPHPLPPGRPQVAQAGMNRRPRQSGCASHHAHAAIPDLAGLCRCPLPSSPLIQFWRHDPVSAPKARDRRRLSHAPFMTESRRAYKNYLYELFLREP